VSTENCAPRKEEGKVKPKASLLVCSHALLAKQISQTQNKTAQKTHTNTRMEVLSTEELAKLLDLLDKDKPLESISEKLQKTFPKTDYFKVGCALYIMLQDNLLPGSGRLAAFYILYDLYASEPLASNPFLPIFINTLQQQENNKSTQSNSVERNFLIYLLGPSTKDVCISPLRYRSFFLTLNYIILTCSCRKNLSKS
jgi:hypothetical protein